MNQKANRGQQLYEKAKGLIPGGTQLLSKRPEMFLPDHWPSYYERAKGCHVWDLDGREYIDVTHNGVGSCILGYADPDVNAAVKAAVDAGNMSTLNCPDEVELAELLCELHPWADMTRFTRTGGESVAVAIRIARAASGKSKVAFAGYHGWSDWYLAANLAKPDILGKKGLLLSGLNPAGVPQELEGTALAFRHNHVEELEELVRKEGSDIGVIVCEPQRHEKPAPDFLSGLRRIASEIGAVLIFDEISSGFRLNCGGVHMVYGVEPDVAVFSKALGNGYPIGAVIGRRDIMNAAQDTFISSTYWTERVGFAAALAMIKKYRKENVHEHLSEMGLRMQKIWNAAAEASGLKAHAGHPDMPPLAHVGFDYPNARAVQTLLCQLMLERGFLDNGAFYATYAHSHDDLNAYEAVVTEVFRELADACAEESVEKRLHGPVGHSGFQRLT
ncbi:MAG: aminotransferase class III-fold pyridoxal phosphate-dependent enzyme [Verrucomicrobia bacterium]|nr:aminotransferase class III-fold pyridoxal phosphate-dependent enzyme [Verrucomicrobiota bacterium]